MRETIAAFILCLCLTGCLGFWFDRDQDQIGNLEKDGMNRSRAEVVIERGKQYTERLPFPWGWVAGGALVVMGVGAKIISDKRARKK